MACNVLVYVKRRLGDGRVSGLADGDVSALSLERPAGHGFGQRWLFERASDDGGLVVWLFSIIRHKDLCLPPSLDARIEVKRAYSREESVTELPYVTRLLRHFQYAFDAHSSGSYYLPWNNATSVFRRLLPEAKLPPARTEVVKFSRYSNVLGRFQTPRLLAEEAAGALDDFARDVRALPQGFVSYRRVESPVWAMQAAAQLYEHGTAPWWDQWAMPRKVAEEEVVLAPPALRAAIRAAIDSARYAISLGTPTYGLTSWTAFESAQIRTAIEQGRLQHVQVDVPAEVPGEGMRAKRSLRDAIQSLRVPR